MPRPLRTVCGISIHALCEEGDDRAIVRDHECRGFLSTPSARRATPSELPEAGTQPISIHALCEEGDTVKEKTYADITVISIHALCEEGDRRPT